MFFGLSESLDLVEEYQNAIGIEKDELNILLFGSNDPRNILHTISKKFKHSVKLNFFLVDGSAEITARNMLLLLLAFEKTSVLPLKAKVHLYMDIYGNSLLRPLSYSYLSSKAEVLTKVITDDNERLKIIPIFNIDGLKYREKDKIENTFKFWLPKEFHVFNISWYWEERIRSYIGSLYDSRDGVFDMDLIINLKDTGFSTLLQEYTLWRNTGIAFNFPEYEQSKPNKTLVTGLVKNGDKFLHRGYLGDVFTGPYCAHGLKCSNSEMLNEKFGQRDYRATDITERNLMEIFYEITNKGPYIFDKNDVHKLGSTKLLVSDILPNYCDENLILKQYDEKAEEIENVIINFLSENILTDLSKSEKFQSFFDIMFISHNYFPFLNDDFVNCLKDKSLIIFETKLYTLKKKVKQNFLQNLKDFAKKLNLSSVTNFNVNLNYSVAIFKKDVQAEQTE